MKINNLMKSITICIVLLSTACMANSPNEKIVKEKFGIETAEIWQNQLDFTLALLNQMPEDKFEYRPNETVRSFSELFKHLAGSSLFLKAIVKGEDVNLVFPKMGELEKSSKSKAEVARILESNMTEVINLIKDMSSKDLEKTFTFSFLPDAPTKTYKEIIIALGNHIVHHRGQATTYLRMNDIQPSPYQNWW